jgi:preprotein translocase subunit SecG
MFKMTKQLSRKGFEKNLIFQDKLLDFLIIFLGIVMILWLATTIVMGIQNKNLRQENEMLKGQINNSENPYTEDKTELLCIYDNESGEMSVGCINFLSKEEIIANWKKQGRFIYSFNITDYSEEKK